MKIRELNETVALVTGSTAGMPFEIAAQLAEAGAPRIMLNGRDADAGAAAVARIRERAPKAEVLFTAADMCVPSQAEWLVHETVARFGRLDVLVNSVAAEFELRPFHEMPTETYQHLVNGHLFSVLHTCHAAMPIMMGQEGGVIINIASDAAKVATPGESVNGALKAAVAAFSRVLALEGSRHGIRVHCLTPSIVKDTRRYEQVMAKDFGRRLFAKAEKKARLGVPTPTDVAPIAVFLASPAAARITGQTVSINGGISAA